MDNRIERTGIADGLLPNCAPIVVVICIALSGCSGPPRSASDLNSQLTKDTTLSLQDQSRFAKVDQASALMDAGNYSAAETMIDQESSDPVLRSLLAPLKLQCLVHRDAKALAIDMTVAMLGGQYGIIVFNTEDLRRPLDFSIDLNRTSDAEQIASGLLAHQISQFSEYGSLHTPSDESNSTKRLAYGYLVIADDRGAKKDIAGQIAYNLKAKALIPNDPMTLIRLAASYGDRGVGSDLQQCKDLLIMAYNLAPVGSELRAAAQDFAHRYGLGNIP